MTPAKMRPRNPRGQGDRLRDEVVDAAAALIAENGPEALSLRAIARKAGITAPAIYRHFDDLDQVREAVVDSFFWALADYLRRAGQLETNPVDRLRALCHAYVAFGRKHPQQYATLFSHGMGVVGGRCGQSRIRKICGALRRSRFSWTPSGIAWTPGCLARDSRSTTPRQCGSRCTATWVCELRYPTSLGAQTIRFWMFSSIVLRF